MSDTIDLAFVRQFEREVHLAYQRTGSVLRGLFRTQNNITGNMTTFQKVGKGTVGTKARHGLVPVMNLDHSSVDCTLTDYYGGEYLDKLDELKINHDERAVITQSLAWAFARKTDYLISTAAISGANTTTLTTTNSKTFRNSVLAARRELRERDVPAGDGQLFGVVSPGMEAWFMTVPEFASADYTGAALPYVNAPMKTWLGINWICYTDLDLTGNDRTGFIAHRTAIGHAIQADVKIDMQWKNERWAHFAAGAMAQGACLIDADGVQELVLDETAALPTA
jgi:hypothetical protein